MKRKLSLLLALVMILSLVPMSAFATTENRVTRVPQVSDSHKFDNATTAPSLKIEEKSANEFGTTEQVFRLRLTNAEWLAKDVSAVAIDEAYMQSVTNTTYGTLTRWTQLSDTLVEVAVTRTSGAPSGTKTAFDFPILAEVTDAGEITIAIESDSAVSSGKYTFANAAEGNFVVSVNSVKKFADGVTLDTIQIDETKLGAFFNKGKFTLKLPSGFKWTDAGTVKGAGGYAGQTLTASIVSGDDRTVEFSVNNLAKTSTVRGTLVLDGFRVQTKSNAKFDDVTLNVEFDGKQQEIVVAKYMDYGVTVKADGDAKEIISGRMDAATTVLATHDVKNNTHKLQKLIIKEDIASSWLIERKTVVEFPSWVKVIGVNVDKKDKVTGNLNYTLDKGDNIVEFTAVRTLPTDKLNVEITFYVSVKADAAGDITAKIGGRSLAEEYEVLLGKAIAPISVKADVKDVRVGIQNQELGKIEIVENKAGAIKGGSKRVLHVDLGDLGRWTDVPKVEVTAGDLDIDAKAVEIDSNDKSVLIIPVKSDSRKVSTITITGGKITLNRVPAEGEYFVEVGGTAVVENNVDGKMGFSKDDLDNGFFKQNFAAETLAARVITPADTDTKAVVVFGIDNATYTVNGVEKTMDVAPYIKDSRTFVSVRYAAEALGVDVNAIIWDAASKTVTVRKGANTAQMIQGAKYITVNGMVVPMDTAVENKDGRIMLPIAHLAMALNVSYEWDGTARTVTFK